MSAPELNTARLRLRHWCDADDAAFAALNADPEVMRYFVAPLDRAASDELATRIRQGLATDRFGLWAVEEIGGASFLGFVGLIEQHFAAPFTPAIEVGWRLARPYWGHGYATEAAQTVLQHGFQTLGLSEIVSMTAASNVPSRRVMDRLGMSRDPSDDFDHPRVPDGHPLRRHVLYRLPADRWRRPSATS